MELRVALSRSLSKKHAGKSFISHSICIRPLFLDEYLIAPLLNYLIEGFCALRMYCILLYIFHSVSQVTSVKLLKVRHSFIFYIISRYIISPANFDACTA